MYRYVATIWNPTDPSQHDAASIVVNRLRKPAGRFAVAMTQVGVTVLTADHEGTLGNVVLPQSAGVILGCIYRRQTDFLNEAACDRATFDDRQTNSVLASGGRSLARDYWGNFVALLTRPSEKDVLVYKDPTGSLPCFITRWRGVTILFSCLQDCWDLRLMRFTVNRDYLFARLASNGVDNSRSPLNEVAMIHRGECVEVKSDGSSERQFFWRPTDFVDRERAILDPTNAEAALRACIRSVIQTFASKHSELLIRISGGLDSSIVAGTLKRTSPHANVQAYTYFVPGGKSDERRWARLVAAQTGFRHTEVAYDPDATSLAPGLNFVPSVIPPNVVGNLVRGCMESDLERFTRHTAVFSGDGGDGTFGATGIRHAVDDLLRLRGLRPSAVKLASAVAVRTHCLTWNVLAGSIRRWRRGSTVADFRDRFLNRQSLAAEALQGSALKAACFPHPWFDGFHDVPWHVIRRVGALILAPEFYDPQRPCWHPAPLDLPPLYSQPVVELSLRIPLYTHFSEGIERGLARRAFRDDVPTPILQRQWKDRGLGAFEALARRNHSFLRDVVLGGALSQAGLVDCNAIDGILRGEFSKGEYFIGEIFSILDLELWARHFSTGAAHMEAA